MKRVGRVATTNPPTPRARTAGRQYGSTAVRQYGMTAPFEARPKQEASVNMTLAFFCFVGLLVEESVDLCRQIGLGNFKLLSGRQILDLNLLGSNFGFANDDGQTCTELVRAFHL